MFLSHSSFIPSSPLAASSPLRKLPSLTEKARNPVFQRIILCFFHFVSSFESLLFALFLQVRVVDVGTEGISKGQVYTLARGVLPLTAAAMQVLQTR